MRVGKDADMPALLIIIVRILLKWDYKAGGIAGIPEDDRR